MKINSVEPLVAENGGCHSRVFVARSFEASYIVRIPKGKQGFYTDYLPENVNTSSWFDQHWALATANSLNVPAPKIIYSNQPRRFVVMTRLPGVAIGDYEKWDGCPYDEADFGNILSKFHATPVSGYGPIDDNGTTYFKTWLEFLLQVANAVLKRSRHAYG